MSNVFCGFVDVGYFRAQGSRACGIPGGQAQLRASACVDWLRSILPAQAVGVDAEELVAAFNRHWTWRPERQQKGVDTLITLDLMRLAQCGAFHTAVLVAGDRDLAELVRTAQDAGCRVVVATVGGQASLAKELAQLADEVIEIPQDNLAAIVVRPSRCEPA